MYLLKAIVEYLGLVFVFVFYTAGETEFQKPGKSAHKTDIHDLATDAL